VSPTTIETTIGKLEEHTMKSSLFSILLVLIFTTTAFSQNTNSSTTKSRPRTTATNTNTTQTPKPTPSATPKKTTPPKTPGLDEVQAAFDRIIDGIQKANVDMVTNGYWNSSRLVLFNYNGSVTKGWAQMRKNRESSHPDIKDVKLDVREQHVEMLGSDGAVVTCLWTQTQTYKGSPDSASGRMTLVFKRVGTEWKAVHLHTSPDKPDTSRLPASEQSPTSTPKP
jgi:ketosteroid isomerase-like protein